MVAFYPTRMFGTPFLMPCQRAGGRECSTIDTGAGVCHETQQENEKDVGPGPPDHKSAKDVEKQEIQLARNAMAGPMGFTESFRVSKRDILTGP